MATKKTTSTKPSTKTSSTKATSTKAMIPKPTAKRSPAKKPTAPKTAASKAATPAKDTKAQKPAKKTPSARKPKDQAPAAATAEAKPVKARRMRSKLSGLDMAAKVLVDAGEPLGTKEIATRVIAMGWQTKGKTPHATLYAAMIREIADRGSESRFAKTGRNEFKATGKRVS